MSKFHSTVSRRNFMKGLGLGAAGLGAVAAAGPVFHDMDEAIGSPNANSSLPWYVKEVDEPTIEVDWNMLQRFDNGLFGKTAGIEPWATLIGESMATGAEVRTRGLENNEGEGRSLRGLAIAKAGGRGGGGVTFLPRTGMSGPAQYGVPRWNATPEENSNMLRVAANYFGLDQVGFMELDDHVTKLVWDMDSRGRKIVFRDVDDGELTATEKILPTKCKYVIVYMAQQSVDFTQRNLNAHSLAYDVLDIGENRLQQFLVGLGYRALAGGTASIGSAPAAGVMSGISELGRNNINVHPEFGACVRSSPWIVTDLPLAPTKPIDAGIRRFCYDCGICVDVCPGGGLGDQGSSMERDCEYGQEELEGPWRWPGARRWYYHQKKCYAAWNTYGGGCCNLCQGNCVFSKMDTATVHSLVKPIVATTSLFNSFFVSMEGAFGYGFKDEAEMWENDSYPLLGYFKSIK